MSSSAVLIFGEALFFATPYTLVSKILLTMKGVGLSGEVEPFSYPLFQTLGMFIGMTFALLFHVAVIYFRIPFPGYLHKSNVERKDNVKGYQAINIAEENPPMLSRALSRRPSMVMKAIVPAHTPWYFYVLLCIPAFFDVITTALCTTGLQYISASMFQMLRGSAIIYVAILKQVVLKHKLRTYQWVGVGWNVIAVLILGLVASFSMEGAHAVAEVTSSSSSSFVMETSSAGVSKSSVGILLILIGAFVQALQIIFEDIFLHLDRPISPLILIGMEGFWGVVICVFILYPIAYNTPGTDHGCVENYKNTWTILKNTPEIQFTSFIFLVCVFGYNILAALVTLLLDSVWRTMLDNFRPITVWALSLFIHYFISESLFEGWSVYGKYQVLGLCALLYGTAIYSAPNPGSIKLTGGWKSLFFDFSHEYPIEYIKKSASTESTDLSSLGDDIDVDHRFDMTPPLVRRGSIVDGRFGHIVKKVVQVPLGHHPDLEAEPLTTPHETSGLRLRSLKGSDSGSNGGGSMKHYIHGKEHAQRNHSGHKWRKKMISKHVLHSMDVVAKSAVAHKLYPTESEHDHDNGKAIATLSQFKTEVVKEFHEDPALDLVVSMESRRGGGYKLHRYSFAGVENLDMEGHYFYREDDEK